jgi:hypothetical protein
MDYGSYRSLKSIGNLVNTNNLGILLKFEGKSKFLKTF